MDKLIALICTLVLTTLVLAPVAGIALWAHTDNPTWLWLCVTWLLFMS